MNNKILLVDDDHNILSAHQRHLRKSFEVITADSGAKGITILKEQGPFAVVVSDFRMPEINGIQFLAMSRQIAPETVRIMLTGQADMQAAVDAVNEGNLFRFLTKPCPVEYFKNNLDAALEQYRLITSERELLEKTLKGSVRLLIDILSTTSPVAFSQASRIRDMAKKLAARLNLEKPWEIELAAMLSQIGCVAIPAQILKKKYSGAVLTPRENEMFLAHPQTGRKLLANIPRLEQAAEAIGYQMKQYDGGGVPVDSKRGTEIPVAARVLKVACDYDLLTAAGKTTLEAVNVMRDNHVWYDPDVFAALDAEILSVKKGFIVKAVLLKDVMTGMNLADNIYDLKGSILIPKGQEISEVLRMRLFNFARLGTVSEPIKILDMVSGEVKLKSAKN